MEAKVYSQRGEELKSVKLPEKIFGLPWNIKAERLVHQVMVSMMGNQRTPVAHTKTRGEVSGSGIKPWRQKGTGRARHGSRRSPIWVGGGVSGGPRNDKNFSTKINKKMKTKALFAVLSQKFKDGEVVFLGDLALRVPKTKEAKSVINSLSKIKGFDTLTKKKNAAFIALPEKNEETLKSFRNFGNLEIGQVKDLNVLDLLQYKYLIMADPEKSITILSARLK
jgi:large subunit ribosomal protein L4